MVRRAIVITLVMRIALGVFGWIGLALEPAHRAGPIEKAVAHHHILSAVAGPWEHFDAIIYQRIALRGYLGGTNDTAFYPLFPLVLKPVALALGGGLVGYSLGALLVSTIAMAAALILVQKVVAIDLDEDSSRWALFLLVLYPLAFIYLAGYTESLFLLLSAGCFLAVRRRAFLAAGILAALATLCRSSGIALAGVLLVGIVADIVRRRREGATPFRVGYLSIALAPAVLVGFTVWTSRVVGETPLQSEDRGFGLVNVMPWRSLRDALHFAVHGRGLGTGWLNVLAAVGLLVAIVVMLTMRRRIPFDYPVYCAISAIPILFRETTGFLTEGPLKGTDRYVGVLFPVFALIALLTKRRPVLRWVLAVAFGLIMLRTFWFFSHADYVS